MADKIFNDRQLKLIKTKLQNFIVKPFGIPDTIWQEIAPVKSVNKRTGVYYVFKDTGVFELADRIAPGEWARYSTEDWSSSSYTVSDYGKGFFATKDELKEADSELNLLQSRIRRAIGNLQLRKEYEFMKLLNSSTSYGNTYTVSKAWVASATGLPNESASIIQDLVSAKDEFAEATNYTIMPNTLILPEKVANLMSSHPELYDVNKFTRSDLFTEVGLPKRIAGLRVVTVKSIYIPTTERRKSNPSKLSMMNQNMAVICYVNKVPDDTWICCFQRHPRRMLVNENNAKVFSGDVEETYCFKVIQPKYALKIVGIYA